MADYASIDDYFKKKPSPTKAAAKPTAGGTPAPEPSSAAPAAPKVEAAPAAKNYASLDDYFGGKTSAAPVAPAAPKVDFPTLEATPKPKLSALQTADLWNTRIGYGIGSAVSGLFAGVLKSASYVKDLAVGAGKDLYTDVKTGNFKDIGHEAAQGTAIALSGLTKTISAAKNFSTGVVEGAIDPNKTMGQAITENFASPHDMFDRGANYLADALTGFAKDEGDKQKTKSKIVDEIKNDDGFDYVTKAIADFYQTNVSDDMAKRIADKKTELGLDPNPTLADNIISGVAQLPFWLASGAALKTLTTTLGFAEATGAGVASFGNVLTESAMEANQTYEQNLADGKSKDEAANASLQTFGGNVALIALTNKFDGIFEQNSFTGWRKFATTATGALGEAGQEGVQQMIQNANTGAPIMQGVKDSFIVGVIVAAPAATFFGHNPKPHTTIDANYVPTPAEIAENDALTPEQKDTLTKLVNGELTDADKEKIVKDAKEEGTIAVKDNEFPTDTEQHAALTQDVQTMIEQGVSTADISQKMQDLLGVSEDYANTTVANALAQTQATITEGDAKIVAKVDEVAKNTTAKDYAYEDIATELRAARVKEDRVASVAKNLITALSGHGTEAEKAAAVKLLANPANTESRKIFERETGTKLPDDTKEATVILEKRVNKPFSRTYAEQVISSDLSQGRTYSRYSPSGSSVSRETTPAGEASATSPVSRETSSFPEWVPEELQSPELMKAVQPYIEQGVRPSEESDPKLAQLYDIAEKAVQDAQTQYEASAIDMNVPTENEEASDIPYQAAHAQITDESLISMGEAEEVIRKYFDAEEVPVTFVKNLRTPRGLEAWGKYSKEVIQLIENPRADTPHHESIHAFLDLFVPEYDRGRFLVTAYEDQVARLGKETVDAAVKDLAARYNGELSDDKVLAIYSEEALADGFYEYLQGRETKPALAKFYDAVIAFLKSLRDEADAQRLYEEIIAKKRYNKARAKEAFKVASRIAYAQEKGLDPSLFSVKNRIHPEDRTVLEKFIDHVRIKSELTDTEYQAAERLATKWGISLDKGLAKVANEFEKILSNEKKVSATILYSEKEPDLADQLKEIIKYKTETYGGRYTASDRKGDGMAYAALARGLNGNLTGIEAANVRKYLESAHIGKVVKVDGKNATIIAAPSFGRSKIKFEDGTEKSVEIQKIVSPKVTDAMVLEQAKKDATKKAEGQVSLYSDGLKRRADAEAERIVRSATYATKPFENLAKVQKEFKAATPENTETHAISLGTEKLKIEDAKIQKVSGNEDGLYTDAYTVVIKKSAKEKVVFTTEDPKEAMEWLKKNTGKKVTVPKNETASVMVEGENAHVIVTSPDIIPTEESIVGGTTEAKTVTFYDTTGKEISKKALDPAAVDFDQVAEFNKDDGTEEAKKAPILTPLATAIKDNSLRGTFPNYFALINGAPAIVTSDNVPAQREEYIAKEKIAPEPVKPSADTEDVKVKKSRAYQRARARLAEEYQEDVTYTSIKVDDQLAKAFQLLDENPEYARAVALGLEQPPEDILDTAIALAVAERAKETGDYQLQADAEKARSLRQTRRGQELNMERARVDENSPEFFIRDLINRRKQLARIKYKAIFSRTKAFTEVLDERVDQAKKKAGKKIKSDLEIKGQEIDDFLAEMAC